ncbi:MAG: hypothetical protein ACHQJ6_09035, partial [Candidatus Berkiellales bacterium]
QMEHKSALMLLVEEVQRNKGINYIKSLIDSQGAIKCESSAFVDFLKRVVSQDATQYYVGVLVGCMQNVSTKPLLISCFPELQEIARRSQKESMLKLLGAVGEDLGLPFTPSASFMPGYATASRSPAPASMPRSTSATASRSFKQ